MEYDLLFSIALMFAFSVLAGRAVERAIEKAKKRYRHDLSAWSEEQMWIVGGKARCRWRYLPLFRPPVPAKRLGLFYSLSLQGILRMGGEGLF